MLRIGSVGVSSFVAVAVMGMATAAFAQDPPAPPPAAEPAAVPPPPVARQSGAAASALDGPGFDFGARLGYAVPMGNVSGDTKLSDGVSGAVPLVLEAGYRINGNFTIGGLFQYGVAQTKNCDAGASCSANVVRLGIEAIYNFNLEGLFTPWVGIGTGYEWLGLSESAGAQSISGGISGFELATLHAGGDFRVSPQFALGPFLSLSLAQYASVSVDGAGSMDLTDKKLHEWVQFGIRGKFGI